MMTLEILKDFALKKGIPEFIIIKLVNDSFQDAAKKLNPDKKIYFDIQNDRYFEIDEGKAEEKQSKEITNRKFILEVRTRLIELLHDYDPKKYSVPNMKTNITNSDEKEEVEIIERYVERDESYYEDGPYCGACQEAPCMCSDRERTSTVYDF